MDDEKKTQNWAGVTKWIVLGVICLTALFLFKDELKKIIGNADEISVTSDGITIRKAQTKIGELNYSAETESTNKYTDGINETVFTSLKYQFAISIPNTSDWYFETNISRSFMDQCGIPADADVPVFLKRNTPIDEFTPNVNVLITPVGSTNITDYMNGYKENVTREGSEVISMDIDEKTQGALIVYYSNYLGQQLYQFARVAIKNRSSYEITASGLPPVDELNNSVKNDLASMLNSFRFISN